MPTLIFNLLLNWHFDPLYHPLYLYLFPYTDKIQESDKNNTQTKEKKIPIDAEHVIEAPCRPYPSASVTP